MTERLAKAMAAFELEIRPPEPAIALPAPAIAPPAFCAAPAFELPAFCAATCATEGGGGGDAVMIMAAEEFVCINLRGAELDRFCLCARGEGMGERDVLGDGEREDDDVDGEESIGRGMADPEMERGLVGRTGDEAVLMVAGVRVLGERAEEMEREREEEFLEKLGTEGEEWRVLLTVGREPVERD